MRDFFIKSLEVVINVIVVIAAIGIIVAAGIAFANGDAAAVQYGVGGVAAGLMILIGGGIYLTIMAGFMYLGIGIYQNTKRTAELLEQRAM
ncbi:hypothetical protein JQT66_10570 [Sulfitobacter mediterraneus]|uniref:hypothetical protein n=1 Tax=Sulfitobacter mediterraneus TaxID=83219 RepID=UPI00193489D3|nr:hypothetical protein [Sulfitobacter mediterraneus]MBM1310612.1 hypothetical protein [Sulfitobacter mediterraneus]MBM1314496.1 hypothetical protein [Sulfitobacter mediterraneus]MBM1322856.1 hypothetical protein [Sulfitobacter mediterraneus]MBM1326768.1 hypothetical protein [Sulfitobacter mediterraneus]MBM1398114.1 hypothetical protein [Sulfitobacter mediterraneus]